METNGTFRAYTLPKERRRFWAIVQTFAIPLALPLAIVVYYLIDSSSGYYISDICTALAAALWGTVAALPYIIRFDEYYRGSGYPGRRMMTGFFVIISPFLYLRNIYLLMARAD